MYSRNVQTPLSLSLQNKSFKKKVKSTHSDIVCRRCANWLLIRKTYIGVLCRHTRDDNLIYEKNLSDLAVSRVKWYCLKVFSNALRCEIQLVFSIKIGQCFSFLWIFFFFVLRKHCVIFIGKSRNCIKFTILPREIVSLSLYWKC